jgi:hypothetical protein
VPLLAQAKFNTLGEYLAWTDPRIAAQSQFLLADVAPLKKHRRGTKSYWSTYQSGLITQQGRAKLAAYAYVMPFMANRTAPDAAGAPATVNVWGQLRFLPNGQTGVVAIQWRPRDGSAPWATVGDRVATDALGYYTAQRAAPAAGPGEWRALWSAGGGGEELASLVVIPD